MTKENDVTNEKSQQSAVKEHSDQEFHHASPPNVKQENIDEPILAIPFDTTDELSVPPRLVDQVIGQDNATEVMKKAALQKRHVLLIGEPGTGKSLLGAALAELLPTEDLEDILCLPNMENPNNPKIIAVPAGQGKKYYEEALEKSKKPDAIRNTLALLVPLFLILMVALWDPSAGNFLLAIFVGLFFFMILSQMKRTDQFVPKVLVDNSKQYKAPFVDATGAHAGALLGDVRHDPFQCFSEGKITVIKENKMIEKEIREFVNELLEINKDKAVHVEKNGYEAVFLDEPLFVIGEFNGKPTVARVLSVNRFLYDGDLIHIQTQAGRSMKVTPEHKLAVMEKNEIVMREARELRPGDQLFTLHDGFILHETDFTREFNNELQEKGLLPLRPSNPMLSKLADLAGLLLGPRVQVKNNEIVFTSFSEQDVYMVKKQIEQIFQLNEERRGVIKRNENKGEYFWEYRLHDPMVLSYFRKLGILFDNETRIIIPYWVYETDESRLAFFDAFISEHMTCNRKKMNVNTEEKWSCEISIRIPAKHDTLIHDYEIVNQVKWYFEEKNVIQSEIKEKTFKNKTEFILILRIPASYDNVINVFKGISFKYNQRLFKELREFLEMYREQARKHYYDLLEHGLGAEAIMHRLGLTQRELYYVLSEVDL